MHIFKACLSIPLIVFSFLPFVLYAQNAPFVQESGEKRTVTAAQLMALQASQTKAMISPSGHALIVPDSADLVIVTGPDTDMLSYRIQGLRNPTLVVQPGAQLHILFVNVDEDMTHDLRFGDVQPPDTVGTVGSERLPHSENETYSGEEVNIRAVTPGKYSYFCSYGTHARNGMKGWILVAKPGATSEELTRMSVSEPEQMNNAMNEMDMGSMNMAGMNMDHSMKMVGMLRTEPMSQEGSGTSWLPASSPMYMWMTMQDDWSLMMHGALMPRYDHQGSPRGDNKFDAPNWVMGMAEHPIGAEGQFTAHLMMSLDPITERGKGYPLLLQTGETWQGVKLVDFQHPHDLFDELSIAYSQMLAEKSSLYLYAGYPGEPALGPPVFMHRPSAMSNPNAPLSHHWMDATHITFGVATAGIAIGDWKLEGSSFNGSEPDENRYDFDPLKLNSYSGRISFNPTKDLALQASSGRITNPEGDGVDVVRSTASAIFTKEFGNSSWWSTTIAWGQNHEIDVESLEALLLESQYDWKCWSVYGRTEYIQKTNSEFNLDKNPNKINDVEEITLGLTRELITLGSLDVELGAQATMNFVPPSLEPLYTARPTSYEIYLSIHPSFLGGMM